MTFGINKGMILAAGLGTRLLPLTENTPKPLVPILNIPGALYALDFLKRLGISDIILNTHHHAALLESFLGNGSPWDMRLSYSREPKLLGTGGGVGKASSFFAGAPFLLINCDFISNFDVTHAVSNHLHGKALATMVLFKDPQRAALYSTVGTDPAGTLRFLPTCHTGNYSQKGIFSGIHILDAGVLKNIPDGPSAITETVYARGMKSTPDRMRGEYVPAGYWLDTGDLPSYIDTSFRLLDLLVAKDPSLTSFVETYGHLVELAPSIWAKKGTELPKVRLTGPMIIGERVSVGSGAELGPYCVLGDRAKVAGGVHAERAILLPDAVLEKDVKPDRGAVQLGARLVEAPPLPPGPNEA